MPKSRKVLVAIVRQTRRGQLVTCELACGHTVVIRRQHRLVAKTRCDACTAASGAPQDLRWVIPRPFCACGCGERLPVGNRRFLSRAHTHAFNRRRMGDLGGKGGRKAWAPGGGNYVRYTKRLRARVEALVPKQLTFTRDDVLRLVYRGRTEGYEKGFASARMRNMRGDRSLSA